MALCSARRVSLVLLASVMATSAQAQTFMSPMGPVAEAQLDHLIRVVLISMIVVLPVFIGVPLILWRYRRGSNATYRPKWEYSGPLELVLWGVPIAIVAVLGWQLFHATHKLDPYRPLGEDPLRVQVIGLNWKWLFLFPDHGFAATGELVLPENHPVSMALTTDTVMQSFAIPALAGQIYAMPGMVTQLNLQASRSGTMQGLNMQFSGIGFTDQQFPVRVVDDAEWQAWADQARAGTPLDVPTYNILAKQGNIAQARADLHLSGDGPILFALPDTALFDQVVGRYRTGQPIRPEQQPGTAAYQPDAAVMGDAHAHH